MNANIIARFAGRLGVPAAGALLLAMSYGCGNGFFPEQRAVGGGGGGGGGGPSGTLTQMVVSPPSAVLGLHGTLQLTISGTLSDGSGIVPSVTYRATGGTISPGGLFTAGGAAAADTVFVEQLGGLTGVPPCCEDTVVVTVTANPPTALALTAQPAGGVTGMPLTRAPIVEVVDALDRQLQVSGVTVSVAIASGSGFLSGATTVTTDANGEAVFPNLAISGTGSFTLEFTSPGLSPVTSTAFTVAP